MDDRYKGKPLLRLLESYVLWAIGQLSEKDRGALERMAPQLESTFGVHGTWQQILEAVMELPGDMPELIRSNWVNNLSIAKGRGETLSPEYFARQFVDSNLQ